MVLPEEEILSRAVKDAIAFVENSQTNKVNKLFESSLNAAAEECGIELKGNAVRKLYTTVFSAAVSALIEWDFDTDFEHI